MEAMTAVEEAAMVAMTAEALVVGGLPFVAASFRFCSRAAAFLTVRELARHE